MTGGTTTVGIEVRADGTQEAARDLATVDASLKKIQTGLGGTAQPAGVAAQGLAGVGDAGKKAEAGLDGAAQAAGDAGQKFTGVNTSAKKASESLGSVAKLAASAKFDKMATDLGAMGVKLNTSSLHAQKLARAMQQVERERAFQQLAQDANLSTLQLAKFRAELGDTRGALATLSNGLGISKAAMLAFAAAVAFGGQACLEAALQADRLSKVYTTITGSSSSAQQQLSYLYDVSNRLGLQFQSTAESAKTFFAAGKGSSLEKDMNGIFEAVASAGAALALSQDDMQGAFLALGQMISKGKVQAEELRGQLGERLPGAFQLAAKAMGMTTAALDKFMADGKLTAEDLLPKLAKVMQEDFGAAAEAAASGLQGQLNRLSTEWTRLKAEMLDADSAASAVGTLAQAMKSLADNGATVGAIISKVLQFAVWTAGVYAFIKALGGLVSVFTTLKTISSAVSFAGIVSGAGAIAVVVAAAAVAITSLCTSTATADEIFRKHQSTIDAYKKKMGEAADEVRNFTAEQDEAYRKSLERQRDVLKTDIAAATQGINNALSGIRFLSLDQIFSAEGTQFVEARSELESLGRELAKLGQNITQEDLDAYAAKVRAIDERMRAAGLATKAWNDAIDKLLYSNDAFVKNLSALIAKGLSVEDALRQLAAEAERTKVAVGTGWNIDIDNVTKGINAIEKSIRSMQSEMLGGKVFEKIVSSLPKEFPLEKAKEIFDIYQKTPNLEPWQRAGQVAAALGDQYAAMGDDAVKGINKLFSAGANLGKTQAKYAAYQKELRDAAKDHTSAYSQMENNLASYVSELNQTKLSIQSMQAQLATKPGEVFTREQNKIAADYRATVEKINAEATKYANKKGITKTQAEELKQSKLQEASLQKNLDLRLAQEKEEKRLADLAKDKYDFYKELEAISGEYGLSLQFQNEMIAAQAKELEHLELPQRYMEQWKELKALQMSHDWSDGAQRAFLQYRADATDAAKGAEEAFSSLYSGMDSGWKSAWEQMIETGKVSLSSFRSVFASFLADLMHMAFTRPITVQIAGAVSGMLGTGGVAYAAGGSGGMGGIGNLSGLSNLMPSSWFSGIGDTINNTMAGWFPGVFGTTSLVAPGGMGALSTGTLSTSAINAASSGSYGGMASAGLGQPTFLSTVSPYLMAAGLGSLGYSMIGGKLGLPQSKYSGLTAGLGAAAGWGLGGMAAGSAALAGTGMAAGATFGSVVPVVGTIIGALAGGALGSLFGGGRKTHASVYGSMQNQGFTTDTQSYYDAFMSQVDYDRAGSSEAQAFAQAISESASQTAGSLLTLAASLPDELRQRVEAQLSGAQWSAGYGVTGSGDAWNFQWWEKDMAEKRTTEAVKDMFEQMGYAANKAFAEAGIGDLFDSFDLSTEEGFKKAQTAISAISSITTAIDEIKSPTSEAERQAEAFVTQMNALGDAVKASGLNAAYADKMIGEYRTAYVDKYVETLEEMFNPLSQIEQQAKGYKEAIDGYAAALTTMGASEEQLAKVRGYTQTAIDSIINALDESLSSASAYAQAQGAANAQIDQRIAALRQLGATEAEIAGVEAKRAEVVRQSTEAMQRTFAQSLMQRWSTLAGTGDDTSRAVSQSNELLEAVKQFGKDSAQVAELIRLQAAEAAHSAVAAAQSNVNDLQAQLSSLEAQRLQLQQQAIQTEISAINEQLSAAKSLQSTWSRLESSIEGSRRKLWTGTNNISTESREKSAQREFDRLYKLAMSGDEEAAGKLADAGNTLLALRQDTAANSTEYMDAFYEVEGKLKAVREASEKQASMAEKQVTALEKQLEAQQAQLDALATQQATLEEIDAQIAAVGKELADAIKTLKIAQSNPSYNSGGGSSSSSGDSSANAYQTWEDRLLAEKVASLNRGEYIDPIFGISAGSWNASNTKQAMIDTYGSVEEWYRQVGKIEGFAVGGLAMPGWAIVGERGPELVNFSTPGRVYTAEQTQRMLMQPAYGTDGSSAASLAWMRERMDRQTEVMAAVYSVLTDIRQYERQAKEGIESMNENGVLTTAKTSNIQKTKWAD